MSKAMKFGWATGPTRTHIMIPNRKSANGIGTDGLTDTERGGLAAEYAATLPTAETRAELAARIATNPAAASDADKIRAAADTLDLADKAFTKLAEMLDIPNPITGDGMQRDLRAIADRLDKGAAA